MLFALDSVDVFVVTTQTFLRKETSGTFVTQMAFVPELYLPAFRTVCSGAGVVRYSWRVLGSVEPASLAKVLCEVAGTVKEVPSSFPLCR